MFGVVLKFVQVEINLDLKYKIMNREKRIF